MQDAKKHEESGVSSALKSEYLNNYPILKELFAKVKPMIRSLLLLFLNPKEILALVAACKEARDIIFSLGLYKGNHANFIKHFKK